MKVIHCLNHFFPASIGGTEVYTASLIQELDKKNIESIVVIPNYGKDITEEYLIQGIRVIQYAEPSVTDRLLTMGKRAPDGLKAFEKVLKKEQPDVLQFHVIGMSNSITRHHLILSKKLGFKNIMIFHLAGYSCKTGNLMYKDEVPCDGIINVKKCTWCSYTVREIPPIKKGLLYTAALIGYALNYDSSGWSSRAGTALGFPFLIQQLKNDLFLIADNCEKLVVLTNWYKAVLLKNNIAEDKLELITQGLPLQATNAGEIKLKRVEEIKLIFIGRISESKGLHLLIDALKQLPRENIGLDIYGQINEDTYTRRCIAESSVLKNIRWKGALLPNEVVSTIGNYDVLCVPSTICEMSPLVIQEAFAAGVPVFASEVYGNAEQIKDNVNGWLFKFNDSDDLKIKLQQLIEKPGEIASAKNDILPVKIFSEVADQYEKLYSQITKLSSN